MKRQDFKPTFLQIVYLIICLILFSFIIFTPAIISGPLHLTEKLIIEEETIEGSLLGILFFLSLIILNLYKHEVSRHKEQIIKINNDKKNVEERLEDSVRYIGVINVQIEEIKSMFGNINKYPETKDDLKKSFQFFGERVLGIVNTNWVLFRIISSNNQRTISEHFETRMGFYTGFPHVSNKLIIERQPVSGFSSVISNPQNLNIIVFCIMPVEKISKDQRIFIQAIINEITKLFVILNSTYYIKRNKIFAMNEHEGK